MKGKTSRAKLALGGAALIGLVLASPAAAAGGGGGGFNYPGRTGIGAPERTDAGVWDGTWYYVYRDGRFGIWIRRGKDGKPELKLQYQSLSAPEAFETDWSGKATYYLSGQPATFEIQLDQRDEKTMHGRWKWEVQFEDSGRTESGTFTLYRAGDGRQMVMKFDPLERVIRRRDQVKRYNVASTWTFLKGSKRLALWDELPF